MTIVDTNIVLDIVHSDSNWSDWSIMRLAEAAADEGAIVNMIVLAECSPSFASLEALEGKLNMMSLGVVDVDERSAFVAGRRFAEYRRHRSDDTRLRVLPDFFIGAHALTLGVPILTRDVAIYRRYFSDVPLITPETHP